ncbi:centromere protein Chl4/mis15/CENP-N [Aspergillus ambiguus]|uniref:CENP-N/CHL4 family protein n=1 Tax=Aspergillus ambiguus TaxID=176160 RepID=UPI003CCD08A2
MSRSKSIRAPSTASLPNDFRIPSTTQSLVKSLGKLSRQSLLDLAFYWLEDRNWKTFPPYLHQDDLENPDDDELSPYPAEHTIDHVRNAYQELQMRKGGKREVIDRILEGDWRHGITLRQLAMIDLRYLDDHPSSLRWTALELSRIGVGGSDGDTAACVPRIHASTFLSKLQQQISPLVKSHYHLARSRSLPVAFLRIFVTNSPYQHPRQTADSLTDSSRVIYVAFPDSCPFIYISISTSSSAPAKASTEVVATDARSLQRIVRDAIPKALSLPQQRYTLKPTALTAKSLTALLKLRGPGRSTRANGTFSIFADAVIEGSPLDPRPSNSVAPAEYLHQDQDPGKENYSHSEENGPDLSTAPKSRRVEPDTRVSKKRKLAVQSRFGTAGSSLASAPLDRLDVRLLDPPGSDADDAGQMQPALSLTFAGSDVIAGIRRLAELGIVDPERMPSWMTGEEAVSVAIVRSGNRVAKDSG